MSKLRVNDLAGEFGISAEEVVTILRQMDIPVRSHISELTDDQVARMRARWEREKRARADKPAAPVARRRRGAAGGTATAEAPPAPPRAGGRSAAPRAVTRAAAVVPVAEEATPADASRRRRRPAAEVAAAHEAAALAAEQAAAEAAAAAPPVDVALPSAPDIEELAVPREVDQASAAESDAVLDRGDRSERAPVPPAAPRHEPPIPGSAGPGGAVSSAAAAPALPDRPRPRPITPGAPRPRPLAGGSAFLPPRPVASASPFGPGGPPRRDEKRGPGGTPGAGGAATLPPDRGRRKKGKRGVDQEAVDESISKTLSAIRGAPVRRSTSADRRGAREDFEAQRAEAAERERKTVRVNEFITVSELAQQLKVSPTEIVSFAFKNLGLMVTINQRLDFAQIDIIATEFGFQAVREDEYQAEVTEVEEDKPEDLSPRPPVVTIMGHVDHGKTSLLDYIRKANVVAGEAGGITQHIGAYHVQLAGGKHITFLDTPGHEAFTAMRARGAQVTDIVVLVVAADDQVMPQTVEAISHAKNAGVPMIIAINKIDLPSANVLKVKQDLLQHGVVVEDFGGTVLSTPISAKKGTGVSELLDQLLLQAEVLDLRANPDRRAQGTVVEAQLDPGKGPVATVLVQNGTLRVGDDFICGLFSGRVRALLDERGKPVKAAGPAVPVQVLGMNGTPMAGDQFLVVEDSGEAREIAQRRERLDREAKSRRTAKGVVSLEDFMSQTAPGQTRSLKLLIKADQGGPAEAVADALQRLSNAEVQVEVIQRGVGAITEGDILLAKAAGAIIVGFHVRPDTKARSAAEREGVEIKLYRIIYEAVADVRAALEGMLRPEEREIVLGEAQVLQIFRVPKQGVIAGCAVRSGVINRQARMRVIRDGTQVYEGGIASLRRFKDDVKEVREGFECGIGIENFNDVKVGDVFECFRTEEVARTLQPAEQS